MSPLPPPQPYLSSAPCAPPNPDAYVLQPYLYCAPPVTTHPHPTHLSSRRICGSVTFQPRAQMASARRLDGANSASFFAASALAFSFSSSSFCAASCEKRQQVGSRSYGLGGLSLLAHTLTFPSPTFCTADCRQSEQAAAKPEGPLLSPARPSPPVSHRHALPLSLSHPPSP